jgi:hypothetical protein
MAKLSRVLQNIFGSTAGSDEIAQFGSLAAGSPEFTTDPAVIQELSQFAAGWYAGVLGGAAPTIEDTNSLFYLITYQLAYLMQQGIAEYNGSTVYYTNSFATSGGTVYVSQTDANVGNPVTGSAWATYIPSGFGSPTSAAVPNTTVQRNGSAAFAASAITIGGYLLTPNEYANGSAGSALTINLALGPAQSMILDSNCVFTITNPVPGQPYELRLIEDSVGSRAVTWPGTVLWPSGSAPVLSGASKVDLVNLYYDGTYYYGSYSLNYTL